VCDFDPRIGKRMDELARKYAETHDPKVKEELETAAAMPTSAGGFPIGDHGSTGW